MEVLAAITAMFAILVFFGWMLDKCGVSTKPPAPGRSSSASVVAKGQSLSGLTVEIFDNREFHKNDPVWPQYTVIASDDTGYTRDLISAENRSDAERIFQRMRLK